MLKCIESSQMDAPKRAVTGNAHLGYMWVLSLFQLWRSCSDLWLPKYPAVFCSISLLFVIWRPHQGRVISLLSVRYFVLIIGVKNKSAVIPNCCKKKDASRMRRL